MAKPIKSIPTLSGREADIFIEKMLAKEKAPVTDKEKQLAKSIEYNMKLLLVC
jgi:hypothetical protein